MVFLDWLIFETLTMNSLIVAYMLFKTTSIGAVGTFAIGVFVFGDPNIPIRWIGATLILLGVIMLKMG